MITAILKVDPVRRKTIRSRSADRPVLPDHGSYTTATEQDYQTGRVCPAREHEMVRDDFFSEVEHTPVAWRGHHLHMPVFYPDVMFMSATMLAPAERVRAVLPSARLHPYQPMPGRALVSITAYRYRESDIGPYNEVGVGVPVTIDRKTPMFTGSLRKTPEVLQSYSYHLPVTTEIAREVGVEFAAYPKFVAEIEFEEAGDSVTCTLSEKGEHILTLSGRKLPTGPARRFRVEAITERRGYLLRSDLVMNLPEASSSSGRGDVTLELGDHPMARDIRNLDPGKVVRYSFCPRAQFILTPPVESYAVDAT